MSTRDSLIHDCVGYRVRSSEGHLGFVEGVQADPETGELRSLTVRAGRVIILLVPVEEVDAVLPDEGAVVLGPGTARLVPEFRGDELLLRPDRAARPLAAV